MTDVLTQPEFGQIERWHLTRFDKQAVSELASQLNIPQRLAKILIVRGLDKQDVNYLKEFISPPAELIRSYKNLTAPDQLEKAIVRIAYAINNQERILVNGDPDADGISGTTVLVAGLRFLGAYVNYDFPIRAKEGHGLQPRIIDDARQRFTKLIITSDCGSKDVEAVVYANTVGIDVIITDHHILGRKLPEALALVNPQTVPGANAEKKLSGAAVAFKLIVALFDHMKKELPQELESYLLSIASLGTLSDRMTLQEPMNRVMVTVGVKALNSTRYEGLKALRNISSRGYDVLRPRDISRTIAPRLNAPGRIGDREEGIPDSVFAVDLLLIGKGEKNARRADAFIKDFNQVVELSHSMAAKSDAPAAPKPEEESQSAEDAQTDIGNQVEMVDQVNERRKAITSRIEDEIEHLIETQVDPIKDRVVVVRGKDWNPGVIGIDTDRLKDRFLRPAIIITESSGTEYFRGSCRSIPAIDMYHIIESVQDDFEDKFGRRLFVTQVQTHAGMRVIDSFGGHSQACGFTFHRDDYDSFVSMVREKMEDMPARQFKYTYEISDVVDIDEVNHGFMAELEKLSPFGQEFEYPVFLMKGVTFGPTVRPFGNKYQKNRTPHLNFTVIGSVEKGHMQRTITMEAVGFGIWEKYQQLVTNDFKVKYDIIFFVDDVQKGGPRGGGNHQRNRHQQRNRVKVLRLNVLDIRKARV